MACNTAHLFQHKLERTLQHKISSLIDMTVDEVVRRRAETIGLLASPTTMKTGLYARRLQQVGISVLVPTAKEEIILERLIREVIANKSNTSARPKLEVIIDRMQKDGAQAVILGCTELSVIIGNPSSKLVDPLTIAAKRLLEGSKI
jgi:aspartate racemase